MNRNILQPHRRLSPSAAVVLGFVMLVAVGTGLLATPWASMGPRLGLVDALFTATSASCVTGLTVVDTGSHFSVFGEVVLLLLFQVGGLGILTVTSLFALLMQRDLGLGERFMLSADLRTGGIRGLRGLLLGVIGFALVVEALGAFLLYFGGAPLGMGGRRVFSATFHAVSAFCNAGFSLFPDSVAGFVDSPDALITIAGLVMLGGLGFLLTFELLGRLRRERRRLSLQARLVLVGSLVLWVGGALLFLWSERGGALAGRGGSERILLATFQSVTARTAGFDCFPQDSLSPAGSLATVVLMFVGAAPGSTGGGVKVSTLALILLLLLSYFRGRSRVDLAGRTVPDGVLREALAVLSAGLLLALGGTLVLLLLEDVELQRAAFEVVSAFGTVGLSVGLSAAVGVPAKLLIVLLMFFGRVGLLTVALSLAGGSRKAHYALPVEAPMVG